MPRDNVKKLADFEAGFEAMLLFNWENERKYNFAAQKEQGDSLIAKQQHELMRLNNGWDNNKPDNTNNKLTPLDLDIAKCNWLVIQLMLLVKKPTNLTEEEKINQVVIVHELLEIAKKHAAKQPSTAKKSKFITVESDEQKKVNKLFDNIDKALKQVWIKDGQYITTEHKIKDAGKLAEKFDNDRNQLGHEDKTLDKIAAKIKSEYETQKRKSTLVRFQRSRFTERRNLQLAALQFAASNDTTSAEKMVILLAVYKSLQSEGHGEISRLAGASILEKIMETELRKCGVDIKQYDTVQTVPNDDVFKKLSDHMVKKDKNWNIYASTVKASEATGSTVEHLDKAALKTRFTVGDELEKLKQHFDKVQSKAEVPQAKTSAKPINRY